MRLLIVEKIGAFKHFQSSGMLDDNTEILILGGLTFWKYKLNKLSFSDIPYVGEPSLITLNPISPYTVFMANSGVPIVSFCNDEPDTVLKSTCDFINSNQNRYDEIICAVDPDRTGYGGLVDIIASLPDQLRKNVYASYDLYQDWKEKSTWESIAKHKWDIDSFANKLATEQVCKKTFEYWWNSNSSLVFSEAMKWSGLRSDIILSKYELMFIMILSEKSEPIKEAELLDIMLKWKGTEKYINKNVRIGSPSSHMKIIENSLKRGAIVRQLSGFKTGTEQVLSLSRNGRNFVNLMHKKTWDPDFPFRLEEWIVAKDTDAMKRYINTLFGRQMRFQRKAHNEKFLTNGSI